MAFCFDDTVFDTHVLLLGQLNPSGRVESSEEAIDEDGENSTRQEDIRKGDLFLDG